jgi:hypothetical protein
VTRPVGSSDAAGLRSRGWRSEGFRRYAAGRIERTLESAQCASAAEGDQMDDVLARIGTNLIDRVTGPMHFRVYLQPAMAAIFAVLDGRKDAKAGNPPYFWSLATNPSHRTEMIKNGWKSVGKIFILAMVLDAIYQFIEQHFIYPGELLIVAFLLAILPYLVLRGLVTRLLRKR